MINGSVFLREEGKAWLMPNGVEVILGDSVKIMTLKAMYDSNKAPAQIPYFKALRLAQEQCYPFYTLKRLSGDVLTTEVYEARFWDKGTPVEQK